MDGMIILKQYPCSMLESGCKVCWIVSGAVAIGVFIFFLYVTTLDTYVSGVANWIVSIILGLIFAMMLGAISLVLFDLIPDNKSGKIAKMEVYVDDETKLDVDLLKTWSIEEKITDNVYILKRR